jgi:phospholipid/cholesterol/gamma-HCH transport system substrate-binding protein
MGIKVGKVKDVEFDPSMKTKDGEEVKLKVTISIDKKAWKSVKTDSEFYVNLAGVIGEKYIEVSPGSSDAESLEPGQFVRGIDPPRIDQLISQGYGLAGKILEMVEKNEGSVTGTIKMMNDLVTNLNRTLVLMDKTTQNVQVARLLKNIEEISTDVRAVSERLRSEDTKKTIDLLHKLVWRLDGLDKDVIREFLQEEGVKARVSF